ncbi:MAG: hypothetical protein LBM92_09400 [Opitutaceae bacterium]|jgi:hypothetical protein|nr:hypothetical protein [Opitutaceae bacterium]
MKTKNLPVLSIALALLAAPVPALAAPERALPPVFGPEYSGKTFNDSRVRAYLAPQRIVWRQDGAGGQIQNAESLLRKGNTGQSVFRGKIPVCKLAGAGKELPALVLDFGKEIHGGIQLVTTTGGPHRPVKVRVRFGESVSECMSTAGERGATNDHAMRDFTLEVPWLGTVEAGNSGFRFVRIDLVEPGSEINLTEVNAVFVYRDIPYLGSFRSNDERLNKIWMTGAYTVHLNMQEYVWDGIKRDRLVWLGDLHPEVMAVSTVFGYNEVVPKSLDLSRNITPLPGWMNGMCSYSLWWIIIQRDWYRYQGDLPYLRGQREYLSGLLNLLFTHVDDSGREKLKGNGRFLDWPSSPNKKGVDAGLQALMVLAFQSGAELCAALGDDALAQKSAATAERMRLHVPHHNMLKQAAALQALAGMMPAQQADAEVISVGGAKNFSTFYGYYMLQAQARAGNYQAALDNIRRYWGGMLDMGATTFWEDFNLDWLENAAGIDAIVPPGKKDIHADFGAYCYENLRHSLCHGWASGPTSWLGEHVLGVQVVEPGCKTLKIEPHLGDLEWVEGTFPTPLGVVSISHKKGADGKIKTEVRAPAGVRIINK